MGKGNVKKTALTARLHEDSVLEFVGKNHVELSPLLKTLKQHKPQQYARALRDLSRVEQRLSGIRERDPERYSLELKIWQAKSRAEVVAAKLAVSDSDQLRKQLEKLVAQNLKFRVQLLRRDRRKQQDRLKNLNAQIEQFSSTEAIDRQVKILTQKVRGRTTGPTRKRNNVTSGGTKTLPKKNVSTATKKAAAGAENVKSDGSRSANKK